jgi:hypothetical protein
VTEKDITNFHEADWLLGVLLYTLTTLEFPTIDHTNIVCFESQLMCGLDLPPSKFLIAVLNYLGCEMVHMHPNAIASLICFSMLCECWLSIPPDTSLFLYFYSPACYENKVFSSLGLTSRRNHRDEYPKATFKGLLEMIFPKVVPC